MNSLKLSKLSENLIATREMHSLSGGNLCICACKKNNSIANGSANNQEGLNSPNPGKGSSIFIDPVIVKPSKSSK